MATTTQNRKSTGQTAPAAGDNFVGTLRKGAAPRRVSGRGRPANAASPELVATLVATRNGEGVAEIHLADKNARQRFEHLVKGWAEKETNAGRPSKAHFTTIATNSDGSMDVEYYVTAQKPASAKK